MFRVTGGGLVFDDLTARHAASKARDLRRDGHNDVELFHSKELRISLYKLDQIVRAETEGTGPALDSSRN